MARPNRPTRLTPELLLRAYAAGLFPMAERANAREIFWVDPRRRGVIPLDDFHVPRSLRKAVRRGSFEVRCDTAFEAVIDGCAEPAADRPDTWINREIRDAYVELHAVGFGHSIECWQQGRLVGGLYGVALGAAFFGESMFSRVPDASKVALVHLVARLRLGGYVLLDTQFVTDHLRRFGAVEIPARDYLLRLEMAMHQDATFYREVDPSVEGAALAALLTQSTTHTS